MKERSAVPRAACNHVQKNSQDTVCWECMGNDIRVCEKWQRARSGRKAEFRAPVALACVFVRAPFGAARVYRRWRAPNIPPQLRLDCRSGPCTLLLLI